MILTLPKVLSPLSLQVAFETAGITSLDEWTTSTPDTERLLVVDLSQVEFAEFTALARILLLAEATVRSGLGVRIDLPAPQATGTADGGAQPSTVGGAEALARAQRRIRCQRFLRATGFVMAIRLPHLPVANVELCNRLELPGGTDLDKVTYPGSPVATDRAEPGDDTGRAEPPGSEYKRQVLPFRWVTPDQGENLFRSEDLVATIRGLRSLGLPQRDARLLANNVISDLVQNVWAHAADDRAVRPYALVGALVLDAGMHPLPEGARPELHEFAEWTRRAGSTAVQLVVGDSGRGLVARLSSHASTGGQPQPGPAERNAGDQVTLWSLERRSTSSPDHRAVPLATRGLWRVRHVIRSYGGAILVHTADSVVGYSFTGSEPEIIQGRPVGAVPGTLVEAVALLTSADVRGVVVPQGASGERVDLRWLRLGGGGTRDADVLARADQLSLAGHNLLITVDGGPTHDIRHARLVSVLAAAQRLATRGLVAVIVNGLDPVAIEAGADALHNPPRSEQSDHADPGAPFLLVDNTGAHRWCGGTDDSRRLLDDLTARTEPVPTDEWPPDRLAEHAHLVRRADGVLHPVMRPADVLHHLDKLASLELWKAIEHDGPGVSRGRYRTPNLKLTNRWVDAEETVAGTTGAGVAAFLLAMRLAESVPGALGRETSIVQISPLIKDIAALLAESTRVRHPVYELKLDETLRTPPLEPLPAGAKCVVCTDILLTTNDAIAAIRLLIKWGTIPVAVVGPLDARDEPGSIEVQGLKVPVVALAKVSNGGLDRADGEIQDIDPVFRAPVTSPEPDVRRWRWTEEEFLRACVDLPAVAGLGHVARPLDRHFSAYFNAASVVDPGSSIREQIATELLDSVTRWLDEDPDRENLRICYVGARSDYGGRLADLVARRLGRHLGLAEPLVPQEIPRAVARNRYVFPERLENPPTGSDVVLVDWGSFDAVTISQMVRLAAEGGARRIRGIVLLNQLDKHEERALTMVRAVATPHSTVPVPVEISFLTSLGITPMLPGDCSLCGLSSELRADAQDGNMPRELAMHARALVNALRPRGREMVTRAGVDAFGSPATTDDAFEYILLRSMLREAVTSTARAVAFAAEIRTLATNPQELRARSLIRLLAAERHWLGLRPLRLMECREPVVRVAASVAQDRRLDVRLRLQGLVVLGEAAPHVLIQHLPAVWSAVAANDQLLRHLLYELWATISRRLRPSGELRNWLREGVTACAESDEDQYSSPQRAEDVRYLLTRLLQLMDQQSEQPPVRTAHEAWWQLRENYLRQLDQPSMAETAAINLLSYLTEPPADALKDEAWSEMSRMWDRIAVLLRVRVLKFTAPLASVLSGAFADEQFSPAQRERLYRLTTPDALADVTILDNTLQSLRGGKADDPNFITAWREFAEGVELWYHVVLSAGVRGSRRAELAAFLDPCPAAPIAIVSEVQTIAARQGDAVTIDVVGDRDHEDVKVFCHHGLLLLAVQELVAYAAAADRRDPGGGGVEVAVELTVHEDQAWLFVRNTAGSPDDWPSSGLGSVQRALADFDATVEFTDPPPAGSSVEAVLRLPRWAPPPSTARPGDRLAP